MTSAKKERAIEVKEEIETREQELKELLSRVMSAPLEPVQREVESIGGRIEALENLCEELRDTTLNALNLTILDSHEKSNRLITSTASGQLQSIGRSLESSLAAVLNTLSRQESESSENLAALFSSMQQRIHVLDSQLALRHQEHSSHQVAMEGAIAEIDRQFIKGLGDTIEQQRSLFIASDEHLKRLMQEIAQDVQNGLSQAMQGMRRRMMWLAVVCGLSLFGTIEILAHNFFHH